jgi:hypothetical protein
MAAWQQPQLAAAASGGSESWRSGSSSGSIA